MSKKIKAIIKISSALFCSIFVGVLICAQINVTTLYNSNFNDHTHFFRDIVKENDNFKNVPLNKISMLASHDSLSDGINYLSKANPNESDKITGNNFINIFGKGIEVRLSKAQNDDIYNQLCSGVRFIDLRITYAFGTYYNSHSLIADTLENNTLKILKF